MENAEGMPVKWKRRETEWYMVVLAEGGVKACNLQILYLLLRYLLLEEKEQINTH